MMAGGWVGLGVWGGALLCESAIALNRRSTTAVALPTHIVIDPHNHNSYHDQCVNIDHIVFVITRIHGR